MSNNPHQPAYDVIISGAGPVGLFLACELALAGCSVLVLEKTDDLHSPLKQLPFGLRGLNSLSVEALYRRGLLEQLEVPKRLKDPHSNAVEGPRRQLGHFAGIPLLAGNIDTSQWKYRLSTSTATSLIAEMQELETVLQRRAEALGAENLDVGSPLPVLTRTQRESPSIAMTWPSKANGLSVVMEPAVLFAKQEALNSPVPSPNLPATRLTLILSIRRNSSRGRNMTATGMYLQSQPGYLVIQDFDRGAFHSEDKSITLDHLQEVLRRISHTNVTISALHAATHMD